MKRGIRDRNRIHNALKRGLDAMMQAGRLDTVSVDGRLVLRLPRDTLFERGR